MYTHIYTHSRRTTNWCLGFQGGKTNPIPLEIIKSGLLMASGGGDF